MKDFAETLSEIQGHHSDYLVSFGHLEQFFNLGSKITLPLATYLAKYLTLFYTKVTNACLGRHTPKFSQSGHLSCSTTATNCLFARRTLKNYCPFSGKTFFEDDSQWKSNKYYKIGIRNQSHAYCIINNSSVALAIHQ